MSAQNLLAMIREAPPQWLKEDPAVRQALREMLEEVLRPWEEVRAELRAFREVVERRLGAQEQALLHLTQMVQELVTIVREHSHRLEEHSAAIRMLSQRAEEHSAAIRMLMERVEEHSQVIRQMLETLDRHSRQIQRLGASIEALGARWGLSSEAAFRDGMAALLREAGWRVKRFLVMDTEGYVFGRPDQVEIDVVIRDGQAILIEIRSSVSRGDVTVFQRKAEFYVRHTGIPVARRILISPMVDPRAQDLAQRMGMEVYTYPEDVPSGAEAPQASSFQTPL